MNEYRLKPYLKKLSHSYAFGLYPTIELLKSRPENVSTVLLSDQANKTPLLQTIIALCRENNIKFEFNDRIISKLAPKENTYAIGVFEKYEYKINPDTNHVILDCPSDMGNLGTIIRTMIGFGINDLALIKPHADIFDPKVIRSSMGAFFHMNFQSFYSINEYIRDIPKHNLYSFMLDGKKEVSQVKFESPFGLVLGNEGQGLDNYYKTVSEPVKIRQSDDVDSLNLAVSSAIALYFATKK